MSSTLSGWRQCAEPIALKAVVDLMSFLNGQDLDTGKARVKRELGGHDLPAPHQKSCRTALNRASKALGALEVAPAVAAAEASLAEAVAAVLPAGASNTG